MTASLGSPAQEEVSLRELLAGSAPTHADPSAYRHPGNRVLRTTLGYLDRFKDWRAGHRGWPTLK